MPAPCLQLHEFGGYILWVQFEINVTRFGGAVRHRGKLGAVGELCERHTPCRLDGLDPDRPVTARAGQDDGVGFAALVLCKGLEKQIDRQMQTVIRITVCQGQDAILDGQMNAGGNHMNRVRCWAVTCPDLRHLHGGTVRQDFRHHRWPSACHVLDDDKGQTGIGRHCIKKLRQGLYATCRCADGHDCGTHVCSSLILPIILVRCAGSDHDRNKRRIRHHSGLRAERAAITSIFQRLSKLYNALINSEYLLVVLNLDRISMSSKVLGRPSVFKDSRE